MSEPPSSGSLARGRYPGEFGVSLHTRRLASGSVTRAAQRVPRGEMRGHRGEMHLMRTTFIGMGAYVGAIEGECRCSFWSQEPTDHDFDRSRLISVDLSRTPSRAAAGEI